MLKNLYIIKICDIKLYNWYRLRMFNKKKTITSNYFHISKDLNNCVLSPSVKQFYKRKIKIDEANNPHQNKNT